MFNLNNVNYVNGLGTIDPISPKPRELNLIQRTKFVPNPNPERWVKVFKGYHLNSFGKVPKLSFRVQNLEEKWNITTIKKYSFLFSKKPMRYQNLPKIVNQSA